jgi:hypothetical protein
MVTGFSLGGGLAAYAGATDNIPAVTFNPTGVSNETYYNPSFVLNFQLASDVALAPGGNHIGTTIVFDQTVTNQATNQSTPLIGGFSRHYVGAFTQVSSIPNLVVTSQSSTGNGNITYMVGKGN